MRPRHNRSLMPHDWRGAAQQRQNEVVCDVHGARHGAARDSNFGVIL